VKGREQGLDSMAAHRDRGGKVAWKPALVAVAALASLVAPVLRPVPALAAFPGSPGQLVFMRGLDIFVMHPDGSGVVRLTSGPAVDEQPVWSPAGDRIVFARQVGSGALHLFTMSPVGTNLQRLTDGDVDDFDPAWSPDESRIVFVRGSGATNLRIVVMRADGSGARRIAAGHSPAWSPNGRWIAFNRLVGGRGAIFLVHPDGTGLHRLTPTRIWADYPTWSQGGRRLAFAIVRDPSVSSDIGVIGGDGHGLRWVTRQHAGADQEPAWSPGGDRIAFVRITENGPGTTVERLHVVNADATVVGPAPGPRTRGTEPDWRPLCTVAGTSGDDVLTGTSGRDLICARGGDDRIRSGGGNDVVFAGPGNDTVDGLAGSDVLVGGTGRDRLTGGPGPDLVDAIDGTGGHDEVDGGGGSDICRGDHGDTFTRCP
jgi:RTX calcium-binding nonapeptide repeat (4 copies)/WD40-like Beta Propeller Repeat